jgi:hypothetical protein
MTYSIFLKYLRSVEEFKKNPHVKIPPKSPCANFKSLDIFKNQILFRKEFFRHFRPIRPFGPAAARFLFFSTDHFSPFPTGPRPLGRPSPPSRPNRSSSSSCTGAKRVRRHQPTSRRPKVDPDDLHQKENNGLINPPISGIISPLQSPVTGAFNPGPLKLLQCRPLKVLGLPHLTSAL